MTRLRSALHARTPCHALHASNSLDRWQPQKLSAAAAAAQFKPANPAGASMATAFYDRAWPPGPCSARVGRWRLLGASLHSSPAVSSATATRDGIVSSRTAGVVPCRRGHRSGPSITRVAFFHLGARTMRCLIFFSYRRRPYHGFCVSSTFLCVRI
jgi:hypothetical protein